MRKCSVCSQVSVVPVDITVAMCKRLVARYVARSDSKIKGCPTSSSHSVLLGMYHVINTQVAS